MIVSDFSQSSKSTRTKGTKLMKLKTEELCDKGILATETFSSHCEILCPF